MQNDEHRLLRRRAHANQVEDYTSPMSDLMGGRSPNRAHTATSVALPRRPPSGAKRPARRRDPNRRRAIADDGGRRRRPHAPPERDPKCPGAVTCDSTADVASVTALTPSGHVVDGRAVAIVAKRSSRFPAADRQKEERRLPPSGRARRCPDHADATVRHRGRLLLLGARGRCTRRVPRFAAGAAVRVQETRRSYRPRPLLALAERRHRSTTGRVPGRLSGRVGF